VIEFEKTADLFKGGATMPIFLKVNNCVTPWNTVLEKLIVVYLVRTHK
jgi:hypothetical protein